MIKQYPYILAVLHILKRHPFAKSGLYTSKTQLAELESLIEKDILAHVGSEVRITKKGIALYDKLMVVRAMLEDDSYLDVIEHLMQQSA